MVEALKKIDKKILIIAGCIILLPILLIVFLAIFQGCSNSKLTYEEYENKMISIMEEYIKDKQPKNEGETVTVMLSDLVKDGYIKSPEKLMNDNTCEGSVTARRNGSLIEENNGGYINYTVDLECDNYKTETIKSSLLKQLTTSGSGLHKQGNDYVFKGDDVDNYITFYDSQYRIIKMDSNGFLKLVKVERGAMTEYWDNKYNTEVNNSYGKNIYADSSILKKLLSEYSDGKNISEQAKRHIVAHDICIDSRDVSNVAINPEKVCSHVLKNQLVSLIDVIDYANASLDSECNSISSMSCNNYNYLHALNLRTWTLNAVANNTYEVYYLGSGIVRSQRASKYDSYNMVIYIDGNEKAVGQGKENLPYVIK